MIWRRGSEEWCLKRIPSHCDLQVPNFNANFMVVMYYTLQISTFDKITLLVEFYLKLTVLRHYTILEVANNGLVVSHKWHTAIGGETNPGPRASINIMPLSCHALQPVFTQQPLALNFVMTSSLINIHYPDLALINQCEHNLTSYQVTIFIYSKYQNLNLPAT